MVSYFVPRGRFLIKAANLRQTTTVAANASHQKHNAQQQQQQQGKWPMLRQLRQNFSTRSNGVTATGTATDAKLQTTNSGSTLMRTNFKNRSTQRKCLHTDTRSQQQHQQTEHCKQQEQQQGDTRRSFWFKWTGFLLRWAPIGICVFGAIEWQVHKEKCKRKLMPPTASEFQSKVYCSLPLRIMSRAWGWLAACQMPVALRPYVYGWYSNTFNVNIEEALYPDFKHYNSISEFFTRPLREGVRTIDAKAPIVSPADGKVLHFGKATDSLIEQVKGVNYSIEAFLGPPAKNDAEQATLPFAEAIKEKRDGSTTLYQCVIYLAPGDYHRFHSPAEWQPILRRHFSGELLSVSPKIATWLPGLFCLNERALYMGKWEHGFFSYTAVGATNVGSVQIFMDEELKTNRWTGWHVGAHKKGEEFSELLLGKDIKLKKGELVGQFNMGSTIVMLFEAPLNFKFTIEAGQKIKVGEPMGYLAKD